LLSLLNAISFVAVSTIRKPMKKIAVIISILIVAFSCKKEEVKTEYTDKLIGYYVGTTEHYDTLTNDGITIPMRYASHISAFVQKNKDSALEIMYITNIKYNYTGTAFGGSAESEGLIESISFTEENLFFINETTVNFWGKPVLLKGNGTYDEASRNLILNLEANDNGQIKQFTLKLIRQKRLGDD
jgi:hypothetical protein